MNNDLDLLISFLGPIKELLLDDTVSEIMGNPNGQWWFERKGRVEHAEVIFDARALRTGLEVIANKLSRKLDETHPLLNAQLPDGSRLAAVLPPVVRPNPAVTIRKFSKVRFTIADLIQSGAMTTEIGDLLRGYLEKYVGKPANKLVKMMVAGAHNMFTEKIIIKFLKKN